MLEQLSELGTVQGAPDDELAAVIDVAALTRSVVSRLGAEIDADRVTVLHGGRGR